MQKQDVGIACSRFPKMMGIIQNGGQILRLRCASLRVTNGVGFLLSQEWQIGRFI
jgi:hypothetical protein